MRNENFKNLIFETLKNFSEEIKELEKNKENYFKVIASSEDLDRSGEIIKLDGWDDSNYIKNPVILANHSYKVEDIVWKMTKIYKEGKNLIVEWVFTEKTEMWKMCKELYNAWFLKTVSVWFIVKQRHEENRKIIEKAELLEVSFVAIPCNPNAVSLDKKILEKWFELGILEKQEENDLASEIKFLKEKVEKLEKEISENKKIFETLCLEIQPEEKIDFSEITKTLQKNIKF